MKAATQSFLLRSSELITQSFLSFVPHGQEFGAWRCSNQSRMDETGKADTRNVPTATVDAFNVPNGFAGAGEMFGQETTTVFLGKRAREAPLVTIEGTKVENLNAEEVALLLLLFAVRTKKYKQQTKRNKRQEISGIHQPHCFDHQETAVRC